MKKRSVGVVVLTGLEINGSRWAHYAVLQRRGAFDFKERMPKSYPGCLQPTCLGQLKEDEDFYPGLIRVATEELGEFFTKVCQFDTELCELAEINDPDEQVVIYGAIVPATHLAMIRLGPDTGGLVLVNKETAYEIVPILRDMEAKGPPPGVLAMYPEEIEAVRKAFKAIRPVPSDIKYVLRP